MLRLFVSYHIYHYMSNLALYNTVQGTLHPFLLFKYNRNVKLAYNL